MNTELYLFGSRTIERWQDTGVSTGFPLRRISGATQQRGLGAKASVATWQNSIFFLADDFTVQTISGGQMQKISNLELDEKVKEYSFPERAEAFFIDDTQHKVYCLTFPGNGVTWCYDVSTGLWHNRSSVDVDGWRINSSALIFNQVVMGDKKNGKLYALSDTTYKEGTVETPVIFTTPPFRSDEGNFTMTRLELICEVGVGTIEDTDETGVKQPDTLEPIVSMRMSKDGGETWGSWKDRSLGRIGRRDTKVIWRGGGRVVRTQNLVFQFLINDPVKFEAYALYVDVEPGLV